MPTLDAVRARLKAINQEHLLRFEGDLTPPQRDAFLAQIDAMDLELLPELIRTYVLAKPQSERARDVRPPKVYRADASVGDGSSPSGRWDPASMKARGEAMLRAGKVAAFVVAGGQGSRLGYEGPKGCFPAGSVTNKPLFQIFAEGILATQRHYGAEVPWYVMTSPLNHDATVSFFRAHNTFGLAPTQVKFFQQGVAPSLDIKTGKVLLSSKHEVATNPDGHGGAIRALHVSGSLDDMTARGVEHLSYFQVDNPLVRVLDPVFIGLHASAPDSSREMSSKMVVKAGPEEKVGVFCFADGKTRVIEYSDMPADLQHARDTKGNLRFDAGSIAIHMISVAFLKKLATDPTATLAWHRAEKKIPSLDLATGEVLAPTTNNGVKLEKFIFDALERCTSSIVVETLREEEFAPIKNATGADSVESSKQLQSERAARWLQAAGVAVPRTPDGKPDCVLEISPLTALDSDSLKGRALPREIARGARLAL